MQREEGAGAWPEHRLSPHAYACIVISFFHNSSTRLVSASYRLGTVLAASGQKRPTCKAPALLSRRLEMLVTALSASVALTSVFLCPSPLLPSPVHLMHACWLPTFSPRSAVPSVATGNSPDSGARLLSFTPSPARPVRGPPQPHALGSSPGRGGGRQRWGGED